MALFKKLSCLFQVQYLNISCKRFYMPLKVKRFNEFKSTWMEKFSNILTEPNNVPKETWESMRNIMLLDNKCQTTVDSLLFAIFKDNKSVEAARNYYEFLEANNYNIPVSVLSAYLSLYLLKGTFTDDERVHILSICKKIMDECKLLPENVANNLVKCFCKLDELEKAIMVIKDFESHDSNVLLQAYQAVIIYLLENGNMTMAQEYLNIALQKRSSVRYFVYNTYLSVCLRDRSTFTENIEKLFLLWRKYGIKPVEHNIKAYMTACNELGWSAELTTVSNLQCNRCHQTLEETKLSDEEFARLHEVIVKNVITNDAYRISEPKELEAFTKLIKNRKYDFVIDGLNFTCGIVDSKEQFSSLLRSLQEQGKKTLVIGRYHLKKLIMKMDLTNVADYFFVDNLSNDDAFVLYATFSSGNDTNIISKDLMRQHRFTFNNLELEVLFKRWQQVHQYTIHKNTIILQKLHTVISVGSNVLKQNNCWHIPYHSQSTRHLNKAHTCNTWACFKMPT